MESWRKLNNTLIYYIEFNVLPNLLAYGLAFIFYNEIELQCSFEQYFNSVLTYFNITNVSIGKQFKIVDKILISRYGIMLINIDTLELIKI